MEQKQAKKRNNVMAMKIGAVGAGSFGVGGIVLFGGALVTATLVSVFAIKATQKRRRRPDPPSPSPAVADEDGRDHHQTSAAVTADNSSLELMIKNRKDRVLVFNKDSSPPSSNYDETSEMGINRNEPTSISILDENSKELMKESMEEEVLVISDDQNEEICDEIYGEECEDHGGDIVEEKCEELGIIQVVAAGEGEIQEPSPLPVLGDGSSDNRRGSTTEQPPMILDEPIELVLKHNGEVVEQKEETLFGNAGDVVEGDSVGTCIFGDNEETVANDHEEGGVIQEAVGCDGVNETEVEDNPPSSNMQLLEEEEEEDYIEENQEGDERIDLTRPEKRENQSVDSGFTDQNRGDEEEECRQQKQEEAYGKALLVALIDGIEEEVRAMEATSSDQIPVEENGLEIHMVDEEKGEEGEQQAQPSEVRHESHCDDKPISAENLSLPLLESELLPGYGTAITADSSSDKGEIIEKGDDNLRNQVVEREKTDRNSEIQPSEEEESDEESDTKRALSLMPNTKHKEEDKPMENDEITDASDGNIDEGERNYYQKPATTGFEQRYISKDPWVVRTWTLSMMVPLWCLCHWYLGMPLIKLGLVGTIMFCVVIIGFLKPMLLAKK